MRALFNPDGPLFSLGEQLFNIMAVSIFWVICCVPIITIGPATSALYYVTVKQVRKNNGSLLNNFFGSFRDNLRIGIPLTCIVLIYATIMVATVWVLNGETEIDTLGSASGYLSFAAKALLLPLLLVLPYLAPITSRFSMGIGALLKLSIVMSLRFFWRTVLSLALIAGSAILFWFIPYFIVVLPGVCALACSFLIESALLKYTPKPDANEPKPWYWE
ncbi:MAG: hypothetical protein CVU93_00435 [Firmicutes bacterium HGW-Firmicutes-18]|nr:MAG: hypothetical protein CVU93_00435 [Firmicutes bacterium HGW-Firmicutes-18]